MNEDIVVPALFFATVVILALGIPLVRAFTRKHDRATFSTGLTPELAMRLDRLEAMVETVSVEVERLSEGQRFTTRLLSEGAAQSVMQKARDAASASGSASEVTHA
jgi:hypothetical protein